MRFHGFLRISLVGILPLFSGAVDPCAYDTDYTPDLPSCTDSCLKNASHDGTCGADLRGICSFDDGGAEDYFNYFGACLAENCQGDEERYVFMERWKVECSTISSVEGVFGGYLTRHSSMRSSMEMSSLMVSSAWSGSETAASLSTKTNSLARNADFAARTDPLTPTSSPNLASPIPLTTTPPIYSPTSNLPALEPLPHSRETNPLSPAPRISINKIIGYTVSATFSVALAIYIIIFTVNQLRKKKRLELADSIELKNPYANTFYLFSTSHNQDTSTKLSNVDRVHYANNQLPTLPYIDALPYTHPALILNLDTPSPPSIYYGEHPRTPPIARSRTPTPFPELSGGGYQAQLRSTPVVDSLGMFRHGERGFPLSPLSSVETAVSELEATEVIDRSMTGAAGGLPSVVEMEMELGVGGDKR